MEILFSDERKPGESILENMYKAGQLCLDKKAIDSERVIVSVTFVSSGEIKELNGLYRNKNQVTDVLSFPQYEDLGQLPKEGQILLGDVVICTEQALLQADDFGHSPERELVYLFVHSMLHLLGYDHENEEDKDEMRELEESVMTELGLTREEL
jgi:probable rRNA maturation factor